MRQLAAWKESANRKPLLLTGVRQCGKTYICRKFGEEWFEDVAYFCFEGNGRLASVFQYDLDVNRILDELGNTIRGKAILPGRTLVIFDEVQACPEAITSLKYFCETMRELHIICAGSLLGVSIRRGAVSFPVGKVDRLRMYPMTFTEFVRADGGQSLLDGIAKYDIRRELPEFYTMALEKELRYYYAVGGMPEIVEKWVETHDFGQVERLQDQLLLDYGSDFAKYAPGADVPKLGWIWDSIPVQLAKDNNKFVFSHVKAGKRSAELEDALRWLEDAGLVYRLKLVSNPELPLSYCADAMYFKLYMADVGLLRRKSGISWRTVLEDAGDYRNCKGAFTENYVLTELTAMGITPYFWRSGNTAEVDFLFEQDSMIVPVEVKAEMHTQAKSYRQFCKMYKPEVGFRISMKQAGENPVEGTRTYSVPLWLVWKLKEYLAMDGSGRLPMS